MLINFFEDFTSLISEVKFEATHGKKTQNTNSQKNASETANCSCVSKIR